MTPRLRSVGKGRLLDALVVLAVLLAVGAWLGWRGLAAQRHLEDARLTLESAREALLERDLAAARAAISSAGEDTERARELTSDPVWRLAAAVPYAGHSLEAAAGLTKAADDLARGVLPLALRAAEDVDPADLRRADGAIDIEMIRSATPDVVAAGDRAAAVSRDVDELPTAGVVDVLANARGELVAQLGELTDALRGAGQALEIVPPLLGDDRLRRYLLLIQQTGESRGTGGLIGGFIVVEVEDGALRVTRQGSNADLERGLVPVPEGVPPEFVQLYGDQGVFQTWQNVNLSPDLPTVAKVVEGRWTAQGGQPLDGVVMLDAIALAMLLEGSGPIEVGEAAPLPPEQLVDYLAVEQYRGVPAVGTSEAAERTRERKDKLEDVAEGVAQRLVSGGGDTDALVRGLVDAVRSGHLRMASDDPVLAPLLREAGVDGGLPSGEAPVAYPVVYNTTAGKLEHFLDRELTYVAGPCEGPVRSSSITVELTNRAPESGLPPYVTLRIRDGVLGQSTDSAVNLQVYGTRGAVLERATLDGVPLEVGADTSPTLVPGFEDGLPVWSLLLELPREQTRTLQLELTEPVVEGEARVPEQPLSRPLRSTVDVPTC